MNMTKEHARKGGFALLLAAVVAAAAIAGTPCPDPYTYRITHGTCVYSNCILLPPGGYFVTRGTYTNGGCSETSRHSAFTCQIKSLIVNVTDYEGHGPFVNGCGDSVYGYCTDESFSVFGIKYGESTTTACPYTCVVEPPNGG